MRIFFLKVTNAFWFLITSMHNITILIYRVHRAGPREKIYFKPEAVKAAIVTCGGLCPGLNDVIRQVIFIISLFYFRLQLQKLFYFIFFLFHELKQISFLDVIASIISKRICTLDFICMLVLEEVFSIFFYVLREYAFLYRL